MDGLEAAEARLQNALANERAKRDALSAASSAVASARALLEEERRRQAAAIPVDRSKREIAGGGPITEDHREINPATGQQKGYVVLTADERAKGFVRPLRDSYVHVGARPTHPTRELTAEEHEQYDTFGYVRYEAYPEGAPGPCGMFWTQERLSSGCGKVTTMSRDIAETYARDPNFYGGTFCSTCRKHFAIGEHGEFVWYEMDGTRGPKVGT